MNANTVNIADVEIGDLVKTETGARLVVGKPEQMIGNPAQWIVQVADAKGGKSWDRFKPNSAQTLKYDVR